MVMDYLAKRSRQTIILTSLSIAPLNRVRPSRGPALIGFDDNAPQQSNESAPQYVSSCCPGPPKKNCFTYRLPAGDARRCQGWARAVMGPTRAENRTAGLHRSICCRDWPAGTSLVEKAEIKDVSGACLMSIPRLTAEVPGTESLGG